MVFGRSTPNYESGREDRKIMTLKVNFLCQKLSKSFQKIFRTEEYKIRGTTYINDTFCLLSFLKHFTYQNWAQISNLNSKSGIDLPKTF